MTQANNTNTVQITRTKVRGTETAGATRSGGTEARTKAIYEIRINGTSIGTYGNADYYPNAVAKAAGINFTTIGARNWTEIKTRIERAIRSMMAR